MEKRRQIEAINGEFQLLEPIIHRVQSFLTAKEAARTAILSRSWCSAWSTRPNIDLDLDDFKRDEEESEFSEFMEVSNKTIQRYEQSNLKIESFRFRANKRSALVDDCIDLINGLITRALRIGATHLSAQQFDSFPVIVLTNEVFEAENLVGLSLQSCLIDDLGLDQKVRCSKLESLSLNLVEINSSMISSIASCCPLIVKLSLCNISSFTKPNHYDDDGGDYYDYSFLSDLSSQFPSLKDLTLRGCNAQVVSSRTLERLNFGVLREPGLSIKFDVPSIRKFIFEGHDIFPSLSFVSVSGEWESDVSFTHVDSGLSTFWFCELNKFLTVLSLSKIHLSLDIISNTSFDYAVGDIRGLTKSEVENLTISMTGVQDLSCYALFDGLFRICRPKVITLNLCSNPIFRGEETNNDLLCKTLVRGLDEKCMHGLQDLEGVNVQLFDKDVHSWCPLKLESLLDALTSAERWKSFLDALVSPKVKREIRFQLKWKTQNSITL